MILILTSRDDATADYVTKRLKRTEFVRLDSDDLPDTVRLLATDEGAWLTIGRRRIAPGDISGVWYRRPKAIAFRGSEDAGTRNHAAAEFTSALEGFLALIPHSRWINHPAQNVQAGYKLEQIKRAAKLGFKVPRSLITQDVRVLHRFWRKCEGNVVIKPLSNGYIDRGSATKDSLIYTNQLRQEDLSRSEDIARCPSLFQERIPKEVDLRVAVVDKTVAAVELIFRENGEQRLDVRRDNMVGVTHRATELPRALVAKVKQLMCSYGLRFGAIDLLRTAGQNYYFLEINPNGQWAWTDIAGASDIRNTLIQALKNPPA